MCKVFVIILFFIIGIGLYVFPEIDIFVSSLFYAPQKGFIFKHNLYAMVISKTAILFNVFLFIALSFILLLRYYKIKKLDKKILYLLLICSLVPGFLIHKVVKEIYHRARPYSIVEFGGKFSPAPEISNQCYKSCSFVSSHAAIGFMFFAFAFLKRGKKRKNTMLFAIFLGLFLGFVRIMQGKHFLSDVLYSGMLTFLISYFLYKMLDLYKEDKVST